MSLLDGYEDENIAAAMAAPVVPPRKQDPGFSVWGVVRGLGKSVPAGVAEQTGSTADILNAYGSVTAATGINAGGMFSTGTDDQKKQRDAAAKKLREQGPDYRSEAGALFRGVAKDYMPDPLTTHGAEQAVAEFGRVATKAIVGTVALGPLGGALAAGAEEGFTASDKLADQGVDLDTRTKVGAVTGAVTGLGFALPIAGKTIAQTAGLVALGGPASFIAQNAATREILQRADYTKLADQYDPFDPVGLTLSTLIPLGFGAVAMRAGARRAAPSSRPQENDAQATEQDLVGDATNMAAERQPEQQTPEAAPIAPEVVDAARVELLRDNVAAHRVTPPEDFAGAAAHETAVAQALDQMAAGQRVEVAQLLEITPEQRGANFKAWFGESKVVDEAGEPLRVFHGTAADFDSFSPQMRGTAIDAGKLGEGFYFTQDARWAGSYAANAAKQDGAPSIAPVFLSIRNPLVIDGPGQLWPKLEAISKEWGIELPPAIGDGNKPNPEWSKAFTAAAKARGFDGVALSAIKGQTEFVAFRPEQIKSAIGNSGRFDPNSPSLTDPLVQITQRMAERLTLVDAEARKVPDLADFIEAQGIELETPPVQAAAEPKGNAFITWIKRVGGINFAEKFDIGGERGVRGNYAGIFTRDGQSLDTLATSAVEAGYLSRADVDAATDNGGTRALAELIRRATTGERIMTVEQADALRMMEAELESTRQAVDTLTSAQSPAEALARVPGVIADAVDSMQGQQGGRQVASPLATDDLSTNPPKVDTSAAPVQETAKTAQPATPLEARLNEATARNPGALDTLMPTEFDAKGKTTDAVSAREYLDTVKAEAEQEAADADLFQVAANCFLNMGG